MSVTALLLVSVVCVEALSAPFVPDSPATVIAVLPRQSSAWNGVDELRARLAAAPDEATAATLAAGLAQRYLDIFRVEGDPRLLGYAGATLAPWRSASAPPVDVTLQLASLAQMQHRFVEALAFLDSAIERAPRDGRAWLMRASITLVQGD
jgi:hypothetical protein